MKDSGRWIVGIGLIAIGITIGGVVNLFRPAEPQRDHGGPPRAPAEAVAPPAVTSSSVQLQLPTVTGAALPNRDATAPSVPLAHEGIEEISRTRDGVSSVLAGETRDNAWARDAEARLTASMRSVASRGTRVKAIECKATMCKIEVVHASMADVEVLQRSLGEPSTRPWNGDVFIARAGDTPDPIAWPLEMVVFLGREGTPLRTE